MITKTRSHQILNESHQAMGNQFNLLVDQAGRVLRYEVRFNRDEFEYLKANGFADSGNYSFAGPANAEVFFPTSKTGATGQGATEIKAAWRELHKDCDDKSRYLNISATVEIFQFDEATQSVKATGETKPATLGLVGHEGRYDYTANGNVVNLAARLCDEAKDGEIIVSREAFAEIEEVALAEVVTGLELKGFRAPVEAYLVQGLEPADGEARPA